MKRISLLTLVFAIISLFFFLLLIFLRISFPLYPLMSVQDAIDVLTPLVLIPIYWLMFISLSQNKPGLGGEIVFMVSAAFWVAGQGMHLSANSINNLIGNLAKSQGVSVNGSDIYHLTYFYDEYLSHYLWHIGVIMFAALLIYQGWRESVVEKIDWRLVVPASIIYGFTCFCFFLEGNTLVMGLPFALVVTVLVSVWGRKKVAQNPILAFFYFSFLLALLMFVGWWLYWGCFTPILEATHC